MITLGGYNKMAFDDHGNRIDDEFVEVRPATNFAAMVMAISKLREDGVDICYGRSKAAVANILLEVLGLDRMGLELSKMTLEDVMVLIK